MRLLKAIVILPGSALVLVPGVILWASADGSDALAEPTQVRFWIAVLLAVPGIALASWTIKLFAGLGEGTLAPWDPPRRLVVAGPYRHSRNPMITGVLLMLGAESLFFGSWYLLGWLALFFLINSVHLSGFEEPGLERRFGEDYRRYKASVPRWIPRWRPWDPCRQTG